MIMKTVFCTALVVLLAFPSFALFEDDVTSSKNDILSSKELTPYETSRNLPKMFYRSVFESVKSNSSYLKRDSRELEPFSIDEYAHMGLFLEISNTGSRKKTLASQNYSAQQFSKRPFYANQGLTVNNHRKAEGFLFKKPETIPNGMLRNSNIHSNQNTGNTLTMFTQEAVPDLFKTGRMLKWSFYSKYGSNILSSINRLMLLSDFESDDFFYYDFGFYSPIERSRARNIIGLTSYSLDFHYVNNIKRSGSRLQLMNSKLTADNVYLLNQASRDLIRAGNYGLASTGTSIIGSALLMNALYDDAVPLSQLITGATLGMAGIVLKYISISNVGNAGTVVQRFNHDLQDGRHKSYFEGYSLALRNYEHHWKSGFSWTIAGILMIVSTPLFSRSEEAVYVLAIGGLASVFVGNIYMNWVAPYHLRVAGDNLTDLYQVIN